VARPQQARIRYLDASAHPTLDAPGAGPAPYRPVAGEKGVDMRRVVRALHGQGVVRALRGRGDEGMTVAEYAVGTVAACGFGSVLYKILTSTPIVHLVTELISHALHLGF
jgi:hypothetical protein